MRMENDGACGPSFSCLFQPGLRCFARSTSLVPVMVFLQVLSLFIERFEKIRKRLADCRVVVLDSRTARAGQKSAGW